MVNANGLQITDECFPSQTAKICKNCKPMKDLKANLSVL